MNELRAEIIRMSYENTTSKSTRNTAEVDSTAIWALDFSLRAIKSKLVVISQITEWHEASLREKNDAIGNKVLIHNLLYLTHTQAIRKIMILLVQLKKLNEAPAIDFSNIETDS